MITVVTGASGLIGRALVTKLLQQGEHVVAMSRTSADFFRTQPHPNLQACNVDLVHDAPEKLEQTVDLHADEVRLVMLSSVISMSTAPADFAPVLAADTCGHLRLLDRLGPRLRHAVYASSCTVYGQPALAPVPETAPLAPQNVYAINKVAAERSLAALAQYLRKPLALLRITQVYGPGSPLIGALYGFLRAAAGGEPPRITCDPTAFRDYCHVDDVADGIVRVLQQSAAGVFNIGSGVGTTILDLARLCVRVSQREAQPVVVGGPAPGNMLLDITKAQSELGYVPRVALADGLRREYDRLFGSAASTEAATR